METLENILSPMLGCFGNKDYKIEYYKKLQGYGLKASDFEKYEGCSRRVFSHWKNFLLDRRLIREPTVKRRQNKDPNKRSSKNRPYIITPLGICYFSSVLDKIDLHNGLNIIRFLSQYASYYLHIPWNEICELMGSKEVHNILKKVCDSVDIIDVKDRIIVNLNYKTKRRINYELFKYTIDDKQIILQWSEKEFTKIANESFHEDIANFILESFCYSIIEECNLRMREKSRLLSWEEITSKEKSNIKKAIRKWEKILETIPFEIHNSANDFIGQNIFGTIKQEQKLVGEISNYFYDKIAPKYRLKFVDKDKKPFRMFPSE